MKENDKVELMSQGPSTLNLSQTGLMIYQSLLEPRSVLPAHRKSRVCHRAWWFFYYFFHWECPMSPKVYRRNSESCWGPACGWAHPACPVTLQHSCATPSQPPKVKMNWKIALPPGKLKVSTQALQIFIVGWQKEAHYLPVHFSRQTHVLIHKIMCTNLGSVGGQVGRAWTNLV